MRTLRQLAYRVELQPQEAALLMAIARQVVFAAEQRNSRAGALGDRAGSPAGTQNKTAGVA